VDAHIPEDRSNPARWKNWLSKKLANPKKIGGRRGSHKALEAAAMPAFMTRLQETQGVAARALTSNILTETRTGETIGMRWEEIDFEQAVWTLPAVRSKVAASRSAMRRWRSCMASAPSLATDRIPTFGGARSRADLCRTWRCRCCSGE
jgi:integrase